MDVRNYTWVDTFEVIKPTLQTSPPPSSQPSSPTQTLTLNTENSSGNTMKIVIGVLSGVLGVTFLSIIGFLGYKWNKKRNRNDILNIPGSQIPIANNTAHNHGII